MTIAPTNMGIAIPAELEATRVAARRALGALRPADDATKAGNKFLLNAQQTDASENLPPYYLVYFLLVDLLGFRDLGRFEKLAWSVPVDYNGQAFLIEHRKFGVGVFAHDAAGENDQAQEIVNLLHKGVKAAEPFFEWLADQAIHNSKLNVTNTSRSLFTRFEYFRDAYRRADEEATARADERQVERRGEYTTLVHFPVFKLRQDARWLALATIDAFFSWTEHVFIHIAILSGRISTALEVAAIAESEWQKKFKLALDINEPETKSLYDQLIDIRRQLRNFLAHGAFGKQREAFSFHSSAGAVPVLLPHKAGKNRFSLGENLEFEESDAIEIVERFIQHLWSGPRESMKLYIQAAELPLILTMAADGTYEEAMKSPDAMKDLVNDLSMRFERAANMD